MFQKIHAKYYPALIKEFVFIEENVKILTINITQLLFLILTTQICNGLQFFRNIKCQNGPKN